MPYLLQFLPTEALLPLRACPFHHFPVDLNGAPWGQRSTGQEMPLSARWGLYYGLLIGIIYPHFASPVDCKLFEGRDGDATI